MKFYDEIPSPVGWIRITASDAAVLSIHLGAKRLPEITPNVVTDNAKKELQEYFLGKRERFSLPYTLEGTEFQKKVWKALGKIPYGRLICYSEIATRIGHARAVRAVGSALGKNPLPIVLPCHRVIHAGSKIGGFTGGLDKKRRLLRHEGSLPEIKP